MPVIFKKLFYFIYLAASGLSCGTQDLHCIIPAVLLWYTESLVVVQGLHSTQAQ